MNACIPLYLDILCRSLISASVGLGLLCVQALRAACPHNVEVKLVQAGHCPHDETPTLVNAALLDFLRSRVPASTEQPVAVLG